MNLFERALRFTRANGVLALPRKTLAFLHKTFVRPFVPNPVSKRRRKLGQALFEQSGGTVLAGPLQGYRLDPTSKWGAKDFGPMLLGTYEAPVLATLVELSASAELLIDIGAADGYFGVGLVAKGYFDKSACFEIDPESRRALRAVAVRNGVGDRVVSFGGADDRLTDQLVEAGLSASNAVVLCDIEGAEFDLLTPRLLDSLKACPIIVELHEGFFDDGAERLDRLVADAALHFDVSFLDRGPRALSTHDYVRTLPEDDRWLLHSEGRWIDQRWLLLRPRAA